MKTSSSFRGLRTQELSTKDMEHLKGGVPHPFIAIGGLYVAAVGAIAMGIYLGIKYVGK